MFRSTVTAPAPPADVMVPSDLIPLRVLELDLPGPATGWLIELDRRSILILTDDIGRLAVSRDDAKQLLAEQRQAEAHAREVAERQERQAIAADREFRAQLYPGTPWYELPPGLSAAEVWAQAEKDAQPKRQSVLQHALSNTGEMTYHPIRGDEAEQ
jgi:hypothetical protein